MQDNFGVTTKVTHLRSLLFSQQPDGVSSSNLEEFI